MVQHNLRFVLIRGLLRDARHWGEFPALLQRRFPGAVLYTPDIPGNGQLNNLTSPTNVSDMTDFLRQQLSFGKPVHLLGISMGGMIAIDWMNRFAQEVDSAVLINTSVRHLSPFYHRLCWQRYATILDMLCRSSVNREQQLLALTSNRHRNNRQLLETWQEWQRLRPVSATSALHQLLAAARFSLPNKPPHPLMIVTSTADRLVDYRCSLQLHRLWKTDYRQHDTAGHDLPLDEPQWLVDAIADWLPAN